MKPKEVSLFSEKMAEMWNIFLVGKYFCYFYDKIEKEKLNQNFCGRGENKWNISSDEKVFLRLSDQLFAAQTTESWPSAPHFSKRSTWQTGESQQKFSLAARYLSVSSPTQSSS